MSLFISSLLVFVVFSHADDSLSPKQAAGRATLMSLQHSLEMYKVDCGRFPPTKEGLQALQVPPDKLQVPPDKKSCDNWGPDPYLKMIPQDPWGREWHYSSDAKGKEFKLWSLGADGREGGVGDDVDMVISGH